ncbi:MAG: glutathione S-transferase family protein [Pseudaminobacter sp.]
MILIGQYDSPFVRRVGIAMTIYDLPFEHRPWSTFRDAEKIRQFNPLVRVPTLVLENGDVLIESHAILDYLDGLVQPDRRLFPTDEPARHQALKVAAVATGTSDKAVSLFFEKKLHQTVSDLWVERCRAQIEASLRMLETDRAGRGGEHWFGGMGHADIAVAAMWRHLSEAHPDLADAVRYPALAAHAAKLEALPAFRLISQPFIPPA